MIKRRQFIKTASLAIASVPFARVHVLSESTHKVVTSIPTVPANQNYGEWFSFLEENIGGSLSSAINDEN